MVKMGLSRIQRDIGGAYIKCVENCAHRGKCGHDPRLNEEESFGQTDGEPCSRKCNCYLIQTMIDLKRKLAAQARTLKKLDHSQTGKECNVNLSKSEEELFGNSFKTDANICSALIRELKSQKLQLNNMFKSWMEFSTMVEDFSLGETDIRNKLTDLKSTIEYITQRTKNFEQSEQMGERPEVKKGLQRSEERRKNLRNLVNSYLESEDRDHAIREEIRAKEKTLYKERLMDRAALQLALKRMMRIMGAPETTEIQKTSYLSKNGKTASPINMPKIKDPSDSRCVPTSGSFSMSTSDKSPKSSIKPIDFEKLASISRYCRETEDFKEKEDLNLQAEKKTQPSNGCGCNSRFSSNVPQDSISVPIVDARYTDSRKACWWQRSKNKISKKKTGCNGKKTAGDASASAIFK